MKNFLTGLAALLGLFLCALLLVCLNVLSAAMPFEWFGSHGLQNVYVWIPVCVAYFCVGYLLKAFVVMRFKLSTDTVEFLCVPIFPSVLIPFVMALISLQLPDSLHMRVSIVIFFLSLGEFLGKPMKLSRKKNTANPTSA